MKVISYKENEKTKVVLSCGHIAAKTGNLKNDMAVYMGERSQSPEVIAHQGRKLTYREASEFFQIPAENYRR